MIQRRTPSPLNTLQEVTAAWREGIERLIERGVTGKILLANVASFSAVTVSEVDLRNAHRSRAMPKPGVICLEPDMLPRA